MKKSIGELPVTMIVNLVGGMIVLGVILWVLGTVPGISDNILKWQQSLMGGLNYADDVINAVECSYLRCAKGCNAVGNLEVAGKNCKQEFCDPYAIDGKVCDENAQLNPVTLSYTGTSGRFELSDLDFLSCSDSNSCCIAIQNDFSNVRNLDSMIWIESSLVNEVFVPKACPISKSASIFACEKDSKENCGAERIGVRTGKYYIWTLSNKDTIQLGSKFGTTVIWNNAYCPKCIDGKINQYETSKFLSAGETCLKEDYVCSSLCGFGYCGSNEECESKVCDLETCRCEELYCCYYGSGYSSVSCKTEADCNTIGGTMSPFSEEPTNCPYMGYNCPMY